MNKVESFVNGVALKKAGWWEEVESEEKRRTSGCCGCIIFSGTFPDLLNTTSCPVVVIMFGVAPFLAHTSWVIPYSLPQCLLSALAPYNFSRCIVFVAGKVVALGVIVILFNTCKINQWYITCMYYVQHMQMLNLLYNNSTIITVLYLVQKIALNCCTS